MPSGRTEWTFSRARRGRGYRRSFLECVPGDDGVITTYPFTGERRNMTTRKTNRRALLTGAAAAVAVAGVSKAADTATQKKVYRTGPKPATPPACSTGVS